MYRLRVNGGPRGLFAAGTSLLDALNELDASVAAPCAGNGTCGKCQVRFLQAPPPAGADEQALLPQDVLENGVRLACRHTLRADAEVQVDATPVAAGFLTGGHLPAFALQPAYTLAVGQSGPQVLCEGQPVDGSAGVGALLGLAVDIGTTTLAASLVSLSTGTVLAGSAAVNAQGRYGADVLSRIAHCMQNPEDGGEQLRHAVTSQVDGLLGALCQMAGAERRQVVEVCIAANTVMLHLFAGADVRAMGKSPYTPVFTDAQAIPVDACGIAASRCARVYLLPSAAAFIGADVVAGAFLADLQSGEKRRLLLDIGTNGEMVLADKGRLLAASCAAGPALEGMNISCGMLAAQGAIEEVAFGPEGFACQVIGGGPAKGLCGSGILAAVRELWAHGFLKKNGALPDLDQLPAQDARRKHLVKRDGKRAVLLDAENGIVLTQRDIRQVQLAKGALLSGFLCLLQTAGLAPEELDEVVVAGQFGSHLPACSLVGVGILPPACGDKITYIGNAAQNGAITALLSLPARRQMQALARHIQVVDLSRTEGYDRLYATCTSFTASEDQLPIKA